MSQHGPKVVVEYFIRTIRAYHPAVLGSNPKTAEEMKPKKSILSGKMW